MVDIVATKARGTWGGSVSVALCTHNGAAYLGEQVRSICAQTLLPDEIIISDDASTDDTLVLTHAALKGLATLFRPGYRYKKAGVLLTLLANAGLNFMMGIPGSDDVMLNYQTTSFHDALYIRQLLGLQPAPEFGAWLEQQGILKQHSHQLQWPAQVPDRFSRLLMS